MAKRSKISLVRAKCRNCGTPTVGRYCHICGQDLFAGRNHRLREIVGDSLATIFALDGKIPRTLWYLIAFPGRLTKEFYAGRIVRYVYPSKLFWFITIVFFALLLSQANFLNDEQVEVESSTPAATTAVDDSILSIQGFEDYFTAVAPYACLLLVPIFALLVWMFWPRRERSYSDYLVFALHVNSFVFLLFSVGMVLAKIFPDTDGGEWILLWLPAIYLAVALWIVYRPRIVPMIFKIFLLGVIYLLLMFSVFMLFVIIFVVFIKNIDIFAG